MTATNFLNPLGKAQVSKEFGAKRLVVDRAILFLAGWRLLILRHEYNLSKVVQQRADDKFIVDSLMTFPEMI